MQGNNSSLPPPIIAELPNLPGPALYPLMPMPIEPNNTLISKEIFDVIEHVINVYLINGLSLTGSVGNILSIIILVIHGFKHSTNIVLVSMAVADSLVVLTMPLRKISLIINYFDQALAISVDNYIVRYHFLTLNRIWSLISNSHIAIVAVERLLAVYFPFRVARWITVRRMTVFVVLTHVIWYLALIPLFTMFDLKWIFHPGLNESIAILDITPFYREREDIFNNYNSYFINISVGALLLLSTLLFCSMIAVKILRMGKKRKQLISKRFGRKNNDRVWQSEYSKSETESVHVSSRSNGSVNEILQRKSNIDMKALKTLMAICVTFLVLIFPTFFLAFSQGLFPKLRDPYWHHVNFVATSVSMLLTTINSSTNFVIYIIFSKKFHNTFVEICSCRKKKP